MVEVADPEVGGQAATGRKEIHQGKDFMHTPAHVQELVVDMATIRVADGTPFPDPAEDGPQSVEDRNDEEGDPHQ